MGRIDGIINKLISRKMQVVILATAIFLLTDKMSDTNLMFIYTVYIGGNVLQRWVEHGK